MIPAACCAACGKAGDGLKKCTACNQVKFCNTTCQRSAGHTNKVCKRLQAERKISLYKLRLTEEMDDALFKAPAPKVECGICMLPMPFMPAHPITQAAYSPCCGSWECEGCNYASSEHSSICAFCRAPLTGSPQQSLKRCEKRAEANDADGVYRLGVYYNGFRGMPKKPKKALAAFEKAAEMGNVHAHFDLAAAYFNGHWVETDHWKALHHFRHAAIKGHEEARLWVGNLERDLGFPDRSMKHYMIASSSGHAGALKKVGDGYKSGQVSKDDYANTLRAFKDAQDEMNSPTRAEAAAARASLIPEEGGSVIHPTRTDLIDPNEMRRTGRPPTYAEKRGLA